MALSASSGTFLFSFFFFRQSRVLRCGYFEGAEGAGPDLIEVSAETRYAFRIELIKATGSGLAIENEAGFFQHAEVLRDGGPADGHCGCKLMDGQRTVGEAIEDGHAGSVREGVQAGL
jgi:hypothetical protein